MGRLVQRIKEPRRDKLQDVEDLVVRGFLTSFLRVADSVIVLKSVSAHEMREVEDRVPESLSRSDVVLHYHVYLAHSIFKVDGKNMLSGRPESIQYLVDQIGKWPRGLVRVLWPYTQELSERFAKAIGVLKFWFVKSASRARWQAVRGCVLANPTLTGIPGTQFLGLNQAQVMWAAMNRRSEDRDLSNAMYSSARLVATAWNPKGMKSVNSRAEAEIKRVEDLLEEWGRGGEPDPKQKVQVAHSVDDLMEQKRMEDAGLKDDHDVAVEGFEREMRESRVRRQEEVRKRAEQPVVDGVTVVPGAIVSTSEGVSREQLDEMIMERREKARREQSVPSTGDKSIPLDSEDSSVKKFFELMNETVVKGGSGRRPEDLRPSEDEA